MAAICVPSLLWAAVTYGGQGAAHRWLMSGSWDHCNWPGQSRPAARNSECSRGNMQPHLSRAQRCSELRRGGGGGVATAPRAFLHHPGLPAQQEARDRPVYAQSGHQPCSLHCPGAHTELLLFRQSPHTLGREHLLPRDLLQVGVPPCWAAEPLPVLGVLDTKVLWVQCHTLKQDHGPLPRWAWPLQPSHLI